MDWQARAERGRSWAADLADAPPRLLSGLAVLWLVYLICQPFYILEPGTPQPADMLMAVLIGITVSGLFVRLPVHRNLYLLGFLTFTWFFTVNITYFGMGLGDSLWPPHVFFLSSLYYIYNFGIVVVIITAYAVLPDRLVRFTQIGLLVTVIIELIVAITHATADEWGRGMGTFTSNNQLGEWAMTITACWLVLRGHERLRQIDLLLLVGLTYLCLDSVSKAAVAAQVLLVIGGIVFHRLEKGWVLSATALAVLLTLSLGFAQMDKVEARLEREVGQSVVEQMVERYENMGEEDDDSLLGRGYVRIWTHPEYLFFGAGEGAYGRFVLDGPYLEHAIELHSSWGTVLFCYGIVGLTLFLMLLWTILRPAPWRHWFYFFAVSSYGFTHQGLRFPPFWILLGLIFAMAHYGKPRPAVPAVTRDH